MEYAFSIVVNMIGDKRTKLVPNMIEALICLKDWENGCLRFQALEDECEVELNNLNINKDKDVQKIDEEWRIKNEYWNKKIKMNMKIEYENWIIKFCSFLLNLLNVTRF